MRAIRTLVLTGMAATTLAATVITPAHAAWPDDRPAGQLRALTQVLADRVGADAAVRARGARGTTRQRGGPPVTRAGDIMPISPRHAIRRQT